MTFEITILGSNSAIPAHKRHPTSQIINIRDQLYMVDCGEGTQMQLSKYKIRRSKIDHIFITHLHGDHYYGLIGLITSYHLVRRSAPLHIYGLKGVKEIIDLQLKHSKTRLLYELIFHPIDGRKHKQIFENDDIAVTTIPMNHRISCCGFLFREKRQGRKIIGEKLKEHKVPHSFIPSLRLGEDFVDSNGTVISNDQLTTHPPLTRSYACCSDTAYDENIIPMISKVNLLYHEATFGEDSKQRAKETYHSTAMQAGMLAKKAEVDHLLIGHFSAKYKDHEHLLKEAQSVFDNTSLATEGERFHIPLFNE